MIINLIGPPAAGKSTFASRYVVTHPEFTYCSIDEYRIAHSDEEKAWANLTNDVINSKIVMLESIGLSWRLKGLFQKIKDRKIITIALIGDPLVIHERLNNREKRFVPFPYKDLDEHLTIDYTIENLGKSVTKIDTIIDVTARSPEEVFEYLSTFIAKRR